ncbi:Maltase 2 [Gryllus bimaculatus]|nr:Maltase 2 [Gryllus bimaculatus]
MSNNAKKEVIVKQDVDSSPEPPAELSSDDSKNKNGPGDSKTPSLPGGKVSSRLNDLRLRWPGSWQDGSRKSAFQPYKPTTVLTNLQRGNIPTETPIPEQTDVGFHHRAGQGEITELDIQQESDVDVLDSSGLSALMWASAYGQVPTVQLLLRHKASVDRQGKEGETALLYAAAGGHSDVVRILLTEGANVNHADDVGNTALMYAAYGDHPHCLKVLLDFVPNHSSNESEWFTKSIQRIDPYTDYYVWEDGVPNADDPSKRDPPNNWISNFGGSAWAWNEERGQFFLHQFGLGQPDLNYRSPALNVLRFWLDRGIDGFRVDAVPFLFENETLADEPRSYDPSALPTDEKYLKHIYTQNLPETMDMLTQWRAVLDEYTAKDGETRGGCGVSCVVRAAAHHLRVGNHDNHRAASRYGRELVDGLNMMVLLLPGVAVTYNGEEIGMEDAFIPWSQSVDPMGINAGPDRYQLFSRDPERTPFQWDDSKNAGFSDADTTWLPVNSDYKALNLKSEEGVAHSHYTTYQHLTTARKLPAVQRGALDMQALGDVVAFSRTLEGEQTVVVLVNWGADSLTVDASVLAGAQGELTVLIPSDNASYAEGDVVEASSIKMGPKDGLVLTSA